MCLQVRETETWVPPKVRDSPDDLDSSGDFGFIIDNKTNFDDEDYDEMSGSGDNEPIATKDPVTPSHKVGPYAAYKSIKQNKIAEQVWLKQN